MSARMQQFPNAGLLPVADVPRTTPEVLRELILERTAAGARLAALFVFPRRDEKLLLAVLAEPAARALAVALAPVEADFPSLAAQLPAAQAFEREIAEEWGVVPLGHPWLKPLRFQRLSGKRDPRLPAAFGGQKGPGVMDFYRVEGEAVHEVAVGPVHAGVIEPGHFRFQCHGEKVMHLEIALGYQYRGVEKKLAGGPAALSRHLVETAAGDSSCAHGLAFARTVETLAGLAVTDAARRVRAVGLELERIANHVGDLGALAGDVGFLPTASYCGRLRGDILNLTADICGNRFGRGLVMPGGVGYGLTPTRAENILGKLAAAKRDIDGALRLLFTSPSVLGRFEGAGGVDAATASRLGMVGPAGRASGVAEDIRLDFPLDPYRKDLFALATGKNGDVFDRAEQRRREVAVSMDLIGKWLAEDCQAVSVSPAAQWILQPDHLAVSLVEGWRGRVCHAAVTGGDGRFVAYKIVDPSFFNWPGLAMALRNQQISDFPLCNKSFNLSYCGHDL